MRMKANTVVMHINGNIGDLDRPDPSNFGINNLKIAKFAAFKFYIGTTGPTFIKKSICSLYEQNLCLIMEASN
jgi:hypothetical protein